MINHSEDAAESHSTGCRVSGGALKRNVLGGFGEAISDKIGAHPTMLSAATLAKYLGVDRKSIYAWIAAGTLPAIRLGASIRLDPATTAAWVRTRSA